MATNISSQISQLRTNYNNQHANYQKQQQTAKNNYNSSDAKASNAKWSKATIDDLAKRYGFNYSQSYANQQAASEYVGQRNQYKAGQRENSTNYQETMQLINDNLREGVTGTEKEYFQRQLTNNQSMNDRGLNAGLLADSGIRLAMNQQDVLSGYYRDAGRSRVSEQNRYNNESTRLSEAIAAVNQMEKARAAALYQDRRQEGYQNLMTERSYWTQQDESAYNRMMDLVNQYREDDRFAYTRMSDGTNRLDDLNQFNQQMALDREKFAYQKQQDAAAAARAAAAASASRSRSSGGSGGRSSSGGSSSKKSNSISSSKADYNANRVDPIKNYVSTLNQIKYQPNISNYIKKPDPLQTYLSTNRFWA